MAPSSSYSNGLSGVNGYRGYAPAGTRSTIPKYMKKLLIFLALEFKSSPFYAIQTQLGDMKECQGM